jgi:hypothetical protein
MKKIKLIAVALLATVPALASAQVVLTNLEQAVASLTRVINFLIPFFVGIAVLVFIYGLIRYVLSAGDAAARTEARGYIIYGIIGIAVMVGVWGLVRLVTRTFGLEGVQIERSQLPRIPEGA